MDTRSEPTASRLRRLACDATGASAIEFAITAPLFLMLLFGILVYGYYFAALSIVNHIAYESARATIAGLTDDERSALALERADELIAAFAGLIDSETIEVDAAAGSEGIYAVTVHYEFSGLELFGASTILPLPSSEHTARIEVSHGGY